MSEQPVEPIDIDTTPELEPPAPASGGKKMLALIGAVGVIFVIVIGIAVFAAFKFGWLGAGPDSPAKAQAGACLTDAPKVEEVKIVVCGSDKAKYKVLAVLDDKTEPDALKECQKVTGAEGYLISYGTSNITDSTKGRVLCTGPK